MNFNTKAEQIAAALASWQRCPDRDVWGDQIDTLLIAKWRGTDIAWPVFEGESFAIFRISDSTVVDEGELSSDEAHALSWQVFPLEGAH
jgi:hypothetical protein